MQSRENIPSQKIFVKPLYTHTLSPSIHLHNLWQPLICFISMTLSLAECYILLALCIYGFHFHGFNQPWTDILQLVEFMDAKSLDEDS